MLSVMKGLSLRFIYICVIPVISLIHSCSVSYCVVCRIVWCVVLRGVSYCVVCRIVWCVVLRGVSYCVVCRIVWSFFFCLPSIFRLVINNLQADVCKSQMDCSRNGLLQNEIYFTLMNIYFE